MKQLVWITVLFAVAVAAIGAQWDRQSRYAPAIAVHVPDWFRSFAQRHISDQALARDDTAAALAEAQKLVTRRPLPAEHLRNLAIAQSLTGEQTEGFVTFQLAARREWRDPVIQATMLKLAVAEQDHAEAARRFAALIAIPTTPSDLLAELGPPALADESARETFSQILAQSERWQLSFLGRGKAALPAEVFADIVVRADMLGAWDECRELRAAADAIPPDFALAKKQFETRRDALC